MPKYVLMLLALAALAIPSAAMADDNPPDTQPVAPTTLPAPTLPSAPVTDEAGAAAFARLFVIAHAGDLVPGARALRVEVPACRQVDATQRFYCLALARVATIQRIVIFRRVLVRAHKASVRGHQPPPVTTPQPQPQRRRIVLFRVRLWDCLAVVRVVGGPSVAPTATLPIRDCVRVQGRLGADDTTPTPTPY